MRFLESARAVLNSSVATAHAAVATAQADLAVTDEAERRIVAAVRAIADQQQRFDRRR
jgi:hypothetical protein